MDSNTEKKMRLDKWLKIARIIKTRSQAAEFCEQGKVKVNDQVAKAAKLIKIGDTISVRLQFQTRTLDVVDIVSKSISAELAKQLYHEHDLSEEEKQAVELKKQMYMESRKLKPRFKGRPTKKDRRQFKNLRGY